ncbi:MAG TPA: hypothetical protein VMM76_08885 [Pirellulaceae bacterium]|nr:hypothetical protein [Pirellulaceae bacterium]
MKRSGGFSIVMGCVAVLSATLLYAQSQPTASAKDKDHTRWVEMCLTDLEAIKIGMTRAEVESKLQMDGGLQAVSPVRFAHPSCPYFKLDVEFEFQRDASDQNRAVRGRDDAVKRISRPYVERPYID